MIARAHDAEVEYSKGDRAFQAGSGLRLGVALVAFAGAILLVVGSSRRFWTCVRGRLR
jgi:hypothetical protein